jgi:hypothetical protein
MLIVEDLQYADFSTLLLDEVDGSLTSLAQRVACIDSLPFGFPR